MANPLMGEAPLGNYTLCFNFGAFCELENRARKKMPELSLALQSGLSFNELRDFVWAGLREHHPEVDETELCKEVGFRAAADAVGEAVLAYSSKEKEKAENPPKAK